MNLRVEAVVAGLAILTTLTGCAAPAEGKTSTNQRLLPPVTTSFDFVPDPGAYAPHAPDTPLCDPGSVEPGIKRTAGVWSTDEVLSLASLMSADEDQEISALGTLLCNNQVGAPSFSRLSHYFINTPINILTVDQEDGIPVKPIIQQTRPVNLLGEIMPSRLQIDRLEVDRGFIENASPYLVKFMVAQQMMFTQAYEVVLGTISTGYEQAEIDFIPTKPDQKDAFMLWRLSAGDRINDIPASLLVPNIPAILMLPALEAAMEGLRIPFDEALSPRLAPSLASFDRLTKEGSLLKNDDGRWAFGADMRTTLLTEAGRSLTAQAAL